MVVDYNPTPNQRYQPEWLCPQTCVDRAKSNMAFFGARELLYMRSRLDIFRHDWLANIFGMADNHQPHEAMRVVRLYICMCARDAGGFEGDLAL